MKRFLLGGVALLVALSLLLWAGFRLWLVNQPPDFRAQIEQLSPAEFAQALRHTVAPREPVDRAKYGRRSYPGRGDSPWVRRSALDGRPRILTAAFTEDVRAAWSAETAAPHLFWRGDVDYTGPVYDDAHGREPTSRGDAYWQPPATPMWSIETPTGWQVADVRWRGHGFDPETGALWLRYDLRDPTAPERTRTLVERPEVEEFAVSPAAGIERSFTLSPGPPVAFAIDEAAGLEVVQGVDRQDGRLVFPKDARRARLVHRYAAPTGPLEIAAAPEASDDPFARHDCHTCHNERERVVGPAWSEIALRHAGANRSVTVEQLVRRIREGGSGEWGDAPMTPHPHIPVAEAARLAEIILDTKPSEPPAVVVDTRGAEATWTFRSETQPAPETLHPSLATTPIHGGDFTPKVGGLAWLPDGRLAVSTWDPDGAVFAVDGWDGPREDVRVERIAEGLHEPLGLTVSGDALYVMQKQEITRLVDADGDGWTDEYRTIASDWAVTSNFHEFGFGLVAKDDALYAGLAVCVLNGGKSCRKQTPDRGHVIRADVATGRVERIAGGFRTPNGLALSPGGELFVTDNQGDWIPSSKLIRVERGARYGWRAPMDTTPPGRVSPPALWLPQNEVGNSPTQPLFLEEGPYAGQVLFGDIYNGGLKRGFLEEVDGTLQGAAFHFSGGFEAPVNRLVAAPGGGFVAGQIGSLGNWGEYGKPWFGLEVVRFTDEIAFEPASVSIRPDGFEIQLTRPLAEDARPAPEDFVARDWFYVPAEIYGGPKYDLRTLTISRVTVSPDRRRLHLVLPELEAGRVVYLRLPPGLRSEQGEPLWVDEAWYTLNALPVAAPPERDALASHSEIQSDAPAEEASPSDSAEDALPKIAEAPPNTLSEAERDAGWRLLFDGESFAGWKIYGADDDTIEHWEIDDGALHFTRDVSFAGLLWNHVNPFTRGAVDLMTVERFGDFELRIDWRISEGGNSGIFYLVPDESTTLSWDLALEMQVLDDAGHMDGEIERHRAGDLYDLQSLARNAARPVGEWNTARIRVEGDRVRHWLNDVLLADLVRGSREWDAALAASKFDGTEGFGEALRGHIALQDHGDPVWFRNVKLLPLD